MRRKYRQARQRAKHAKILAISLILITKSLAGLTPWRSMKNWLLASLAPWRSWRYFRPIQGQLLIFHSLYLNIPFFIRRVLGGPVTIADITYCSQASDR
ncbi:hypothetical protein RCIA16 [Methanocella arvoryzae MRE50]|uniref:Uncharacterized protein n=1 Tax=Methanocella arvoryzae (strain DSM 22066 / NBRC 105507 / MRE50) TaxID=351160 RepID=Q0W6Z5_METAR|nr:hypothetical protein RCIA16 [Methanocella arvoryzae MRE50]